MEKSLKLYVEKNILNYMLVDFLKLYARKNSWNYMLEKFLKYIDGKLGVDTSGFSIGIIMAQGYGITL